ncbi:hypothetical protein FFI94_018310 [Rhodococcus sp. KBS0724]|uniref:hypothetical protein n=1 Tax=Rhodococcus sp. KBS0724 TaxID=1179674 RepID=UPI0011850399|nr:hypothetical protein [Rhodococcus sp. KBS0724]TSD47882.1 hypothetical protein FFI94_018310 [Rhodococcus sp. KBS0724]
MLPPSWLKYDQVGEDVIGMLACRYGYPDVVGWPSDGTEPDKEFLTPTAIDDPGMSASRNEMLRR